MFDALRAGGEKEKEKAEIEEVMVGNLEKEIEPLLGYKGEGEGVFFGGAERMTLAEVFSHCHSAVPTANYTNDVVNRHSQPPLCFDCMRTAKRDYLPPQRIRVCKLFPTTPNGGKR